MSASIVLLFYSLFANLQFHFCLTLIFKKTTQQHHKKRTVERATSTSTAPGRWRLNPLMEYLRWLFPSSFCSVHSSLTLVFIFFGTYCFHFKYSCTRIFPPPVFTEPYKRSQHNSSTKKEEGRYRVCYFVYLIIL